MKKVLCYIWLWNLIGINLIAAQQQTGSGIQVTAAKGTGRTTGHIANLTVVNNNSVPADIQPQTLYIPSDGRYQSYVARIPEGISVPPNSTATVPVNGYCADVRTPPVPDGGGMSPISQWIPVGDPSAIPVGGPPSVPEPMNPPGANSPPTEGIPVLVIPNDPLPSFDHSNIPVIKSSPLFKPVIAPDPGIIITWPGTDLPVGGTIDPEGKPEITAPVLVKVLEEIEDAFDVIQSGGEVHTPFSASPAKERESVIQQTFWIYTAALTGDPYTKQDFTTKVIEQFEDNTGTLVSKLPEEQKEELDAGITDFWNTFQATGVSAKVLSVDSPELDLSPNILATVRVPSCKCNNISYTLEVKRAGVVEHSETHTTPSNPKVSIPNFKYGDVLAIKITNIRVNCACTGAACIFYPAQSTDSNRPGYTEADLSKPGKVDIEMENDGAGVIGDKGNNNCQNKDKSWNADGDEFTFTLETRDEKTQEPSVFQRLRIKSYCMLDGCRKTLCAKIIQINFVTAR